MKRPLQLAAILLAMTFAATTLFAQSQGHKDSGTQGTSSATAGRSGGSGGGTTARGGTGGGGNNSHGHHNPAANTGFVHVDPFHPEIHLPGSRLGCRGCGYSTYGGYVYSGYEGNYYNSVGPTATDRILANGGTFNNINDSADEQPQAPQQQQPIYIRPEYPTHYATDNSTVNTPIQNSVASASSDSPAILIFKDGTNLTIRNYAIYGANIVVLTPERHKFPIAALDVTATQKANEAAGYELKIPAVFTTH